MKKILFLILGIFLLNFVSALSNIENSIHINVLVTNSSNNDSILRGTFDFAFNVSLTENCNSVVKNYTFLNRKTDGGGRINFYLTGISFNDSQYFLCSYRSGVLQNVSKIVYNPYSLLSNSSDNWDNLNTINTTQMQNNGGILNLIMGFFNGLYCQLTGCTMSGNLQMGGNNINGSGNISATYFKGNGSLLTDIAATEQDLAWNGNYSIFTGLINNASYLSTYNSTYAASTANNSFNQSLTDTLYSNIKWGYNMTTAAYDLYNAVWLSTYNSTYDATTSTWNGNSTALIGCINNASYLSTYNSTYAASVSNNSWNESRAILVSELITTYNSTYHGLISNASYLSTYNATYAGYSINVSINYTKQTYDTYDTRWSGGNASFNQSLTDLLYAGIEWDYNMTTATYNLYNAIWSRTDNSTYSNILNQNCPTGKVVNGTLINGTIICTTVTASMDYTNIAMTNLTETWDTGMNITMGTGGWFKGLFNWIIGTISNRYLYFNGTDLNFNETSLNSTIVTQGVLAGFNSTSNDTYSATTSAWNGNSTALIGCINNASYLSTYNSTYASGIANNSWNETYANGLYIATGNTSIYNGLINNASYLSTYNSTYAGYSTNVSINYTLQTYNAYNTIWSTTVNSSYRLETNYTFVSNVNMTTKNITTVDCIHFINGGKICGVI